MTVREPPTLVFEPGSCVVFTGGEYSDFSLSAILIARERLDLRDLAERYRAEFKPQWHGQTPHPDGFPAWLCAQGLAMDARYTEVHCGSYGSFSLEDNG
jgi:hypothetical protein